MELVDLLPHQRGYRITAGNDALRLSDKRQIKNTRTRWGWWRTTDMTKWIQIELGNLSHVLGQLLGYLDHHMSRQHISRNTKNTILGRAKHTHETWLTEILPRSDQAPIIKRKTSWGPSLSISYPVLSSSCLASLSLQANSSLKAASCWVLKDLFCFLCSSRYDSSVYIGFIYFCAGGRHTGTNVMREAAVWKCKNMSAIKKTVSLLDLESGLKCRGGFFNSAKCQFNLRDVWSEMCANLQGNVFALVPNRLQKARLSVVEVQQLRPHTVVDIKKVVGVSPSVLHHLLRQGATAARSEDSSHFNSSESVDLFSK